MNILITGATGFIGKHLVNQLAKTEHHVVCAIRKSSNIEELKKYKNIEWYVIDFSDSEMLREICKGIDVIFHLAGQMGGFGIPYSRFYDINCRFTKDLIKTANEVGVKHFVYCSTPGVLGFGKRLALESEPYAPRNDYEKTKVIAEQIVKKISEDSSQMVYTIIRPDFVYGPGDTRRAKMYRGIQNRRFVLTTSGKSYLHPTYIEDVIQGFMCCIGNEQAYNQVFNIAAKDDITSKEYLKIIASCTGTKIIHINIGVKLSRLFASLIDFAYRKLLGKEGFVSKNKIDFLAMDHSSSIEKAIYKLEYTPKYSCREGIELSIKWCLENNLM